MSARPTEFAAAQDTLRNLYRIAPEMARVRHAARTVDRDPADLLPFVAEHELGGPRGGASPSDMLCAALAASQDSAIRLAAARHGVRIAALGVEVSGWTDVRGVLAIDREVPVGFQTLLSTVRLELAAGTDPEAVQRMLADAERTCIVLATLRRAMSVYIRIQHNAQAPFALAA